MTEEKLNEANDLKSRINVIEKQLGLIKSFRKENEIYYNSGSSQFIVPKLLDETIRKFCISEYENELKICKQEFQNL